MGHIKSTHAHAVRDTAHAHGQDTMIVLARSGVPHHHCDDKCIADLETEIASLKADADFARSELASVIAEYGNAKNEMREERSKFYVQREQLERQNAALVEALKAAGSCTPYRQMGHTVCQHGYRTGFCPIQSALAAARGEEVMPDAST